MSIVQVRGAIKLASHPKTASTALSGNTLTLLTSGQLVAATNTTLVFGGILCADIAATDDDYADTTQKLLITLQPDAEYLMLCTGATAAATTHVGNAYDLSDSATLDLGNTSYKQFVVTKVIDDTHVMVKANFAVITQA